MLSEREVVKGEGLDLVVLTPWFPNRPDGFPARYIADSSLALSGLGHPVRVAVFRGWVPSVLSGFAGHEHRGEIDAAAFEGIECIAASRYLHLPRGLLRPLTMWASEIAIRRKLHQLVANRRPDLVLVHTEMLAAAAVPLAHALKLPVFVLLHGQNTNAGYLDWIRRSERFRTAMASVDRLLIVGEPLRDYAVELAGRSDHIEVVWNGVSAPTESRATPVPDTEPVHLITVANLQEGKGIDLLLEGLYQLQRQGLGEWDLQIVGGGPLAGALKDQVASLGLSDRVRFLGNRTNSEVFAALSQCDAFILPSYREAFGIVYAEAMAMGLLTIGVRGQGPDQFIEDGQTGFLLEPRSSEAVADRLRWIMDSDRAVWRSIAARGKDFARQHLTWGAHAARLTELASKLLSDRTVSLDAGAGRARL